MLAPTSEIAAGLDLLLLAVEAREGRLLTELDGFACRLGLSVGAMAFDSKIIVHPESIDDEWPRLFCCNTARGVCSRARHQCYRVSASTVCAGVDVKTKTVHLRVEIDGRDAAQQMRSKPS